MDDDTYDIGLGNFDVGTRGNAKLDYVSFWDKQAKNFHGLIIGQKLLNGTHLSLNGL